MGPKPAWRLTAISQIKTVGYYTAIDISVVHILFVYRHNLWALSRIIDLFWRLFTLVQPWQRLLYSPIPSSLIIFPAPTKRKEDLASTIFRPFTTCAFEHVWKDTQARARSAAERTGGAARYCWAEGRVETTWASTNQYETPRFWGTAWRDSLRIEMVWAAGSGSYIAWRDVDAGQGRILDLEAVNKENRLMPCKSQWRRKTLD